MIESGQNVAPVARRAWLFRVAANEAALLWRQKATTDRVLEKQSRHLTETIDDEAADKLILNETTEKLHRAVQRLPDQWRQVVRLRINENLTFQQIADQLEIPLGTALTRMRRALERLRSEIESDDQP
jgi:RNA polymerase sigma-70 factor (ECF subfamily)